MLIRSGDIRDQSRITGTIRRCTIFVNIRNLCL